MPAREPSWWYSQSPRWQARVLQPVANLYAKIAERRIHRADPYVSRLPVICVGNFTAGGTGKTPMALLVADIVQSVGREPWFLSRGYGGRLDGQERVDPKRHTAADAGDEPLLLAARAPTVISRNRALGAEFIARHAPADAVIIMDDGLQNPSLAKTLSIALIDGARGLGNGRVIPAGPLRAPADFQIARADVLVINGANDARARVDITDMADDNLVPILSAKPVPVGDTAWLKGQPVVAFAGIANPERFFTLLEALGAAVVERVAFEDHQSMPEKAALELLSAAKKNSARLVTTEKDYVRLAGLAGARVEVRETTTPIAIKLAMTDGDRQTLTAMVETAILRKS